MSDEHRMPLPVVDSATVEVPEALPAPEVKSARLVATLAGFGAVAGLLIVLVFQWAQPKIEAHQAAVLQAAIQEVLAEPPHVQTVFVYQGKLVDKLPAGVDSTGLDRVYLGLGPGGNPVGFAITGAEPGFQDLIHLIFGYDPASGKILGMKVMEEQETPGLGSRIETDSAFVNGFAGALSPIQGVKAGSGHDRHDVDMITGSTISSRAVIRIINDRLEKLGPLLKAYRYAGGQR